MIRTNKGFTLVELMVVIVIIGILAALAIPKFTQASVKAKLSEAPTVIASVENAALARLAETSALPAAWADLVCDDPSGADFSKWFAYSADFTGPVVVTATGGAGLPAGSLVSSISSLGVIDHTNNGYDAYLPNFETP